jgi:hypothetical protein
VLLITRFFDFGGRRDRIGGALKGSADQCPLSGVKRTCRFALQMSANDPKADIAALI